MKYLLQKFTITFACHVFFDPIYAEGSPGMYRRIDIIKCPLVRGYLPARMHVPLAQQQDQLLFGKIGIDIGKHNAMKGQIPGGIPGVFPFIGHRDDILVEEVGPLMVAPIASFWRRRWLARVAV